MDEWDECCACYKRAKEGFVRVLGEGSAKALDAAYRVANQTLHFDEKIMEFKRLWEMANVSLPDEAVTFDIASQLGFEFNENKGQYEEAKVFDFAAL